MLFHTTLSRYVGRHFLLAFLCSLAAFLTLIFMLDMIELMRRTATRIDITTVILIKMAILKLPTMAHQILPFTILIGCMITMWNLSRSSELVIIRSVGISIWQFLTPVIILSFIIGIIDITVLNPVSALLYKSYERTENSVIFQKQDAFNLSENGLWLRESIGNGEQIVVHAKKILQNKTYLMMYDLSFFHIGPKEQFIDRIEASSGALKEGKFELYNVWKMYPDQPSQYSDKLYLDTSLTIKRVQENFSKIESISIWKLPIFISFLESSGFSSERYKIYFHSLVSYPFLFCAMVFMAAIFSVSPNQRSGKGLLRVLGATGTGFTLYFFSKLTVAFGLNSTLPLWLSAWTPTLVTLMLGITILLHLEDG